MAQWRKKEKDEIYSDEEIEARLVNIIKTKNLPIAELMLLPVDDQKWGQRLVGIIRFQEESLTSKIKQSINLLNFIVKDISIK